MTGNNTVRGSMMPGGITGGGLDDMINCHATADIIVLGDGGAAAGVLGGGLEGSLIDCTATGTVTAEGDNCFALGGLAGCAGYVREGKVINCHSNGVAITASGENNLMIGGLLGYTGTYDWIPGYEDTPTPITECSADTTIEISESTSRVGGLVGGSFYHVDYAEAIPIPSRYAISDCTTSGSITGGSEALGSIAGYAYNSTVENCASTMTINGDSGPLQVGLSERAFAGGLGTESDPYQIATAEQLDQVRHYLNKNFVLTADIDLSGYENWQPIGTFQPLSEAPEDAETPNPELAFTGSFDGGGHTIANVKINQPSGWAIGLFGCAVGTESEPGSIHDLTVENVDVTGFYLVGGVVGLQNTNFTVENVALTGSNTVRGLQGIGGVVGTSFDTVRGCTAVADVVAMGDDGACAGVVVGGTDGGSLINCRATGGSVTATGNSCWALGGVCGAPYAAPEITNCTAENVTITALGTDNRLIGGLAGFTGAYGEDAPTLVTGCAVAEANINVSDSATCIGGLIGGSTTGSTQTTPSIFAVSSCSTSGAITGGVQSVGSIVGYAYHSTVENCASTMTWGGGSPFGQVGLAESGRKELGLLESDHRESDNEEADTAAPDDWESNNEEPDTMTPDHGESDNEEPDTMKPDHEESDNEESGNGDVLAA